MESIYRRTHKTRLPRQKRTIRMQGADEDRGKWIRCWNCHFPVKIDRDLGDPEYSGIQISDAYIEGNPPFGSGDTDATVIVMDSVDMIGIALENNQPDGTPETTFYTPRISEAVRGCRFCGCANLL